jgi:hypothetical protein
MQTKELLRTALDDKGISTEIVGDSIYRFSQYQCEWMIPQHIIDVMLAKDLDNATNYITRKLFYLVRRLED